jgi:hypothetical protein
MAKSDVIWTLLPAGRVRGRRRLKLSVLVSPRLTPEAADEQRLEAFRPFLDWPETLGRARFSVRVNGTALDARLMHAPDSMLWRKLFGPDTPVAGFVFKDMSKVNLRSFPVRNVLGYLRRHYGRLGVQAASNLPTLLPWNAAHPDLKGMLTEVGTRTQKIPFGREMLEVPLPGFGRFYDDKGLGRVLAEAVFGPNSQFRRPVAGADGNPDGATVGMRALPPDWFNPRPGGPGTPLAPTPGAMVMDQFRSEAEYALWQSDRFYRRTPISDAERRMRRPDFIAVAAAPKVPDYDFHRIVASYGDYPALLRRLGLVLDLEIDAASVDALMLASGGTGDGVVQLAIEWTRAQPFRDQRPRTAFRADAQRFFTRPRSADRVRGLMRLEGASDGHGVAKHSRSPFDLSQVDVDGAALKTVGFTLTAQGLVAKQLDFSRPDGAVTYTTGDRQGVAALRSGGLGVSRHGRAQAVALEAAQAALRNARIAANAAASVLMFAEDVHKGWRVDVAAVPDSAQPGRWLSLVQRTGQYRLSATGELLDLPADEGIVSGASTTSDGEVPDDHYLHEMLFRWNGWSLAAPRPGRAIRARRVEGTELQAEEPADIDEVAANGNGLEVRFRATPGTLPKLRFGQLYRVRAREVDAAGNSLAIDEPEPLEQASEAVGYWRFEPVDPPAMVQRHRLSEGESLERMVIRSDFDVRAKDYAATPAFAAAAALPASADFAYPAVNERHLLPPKAAQQLCETHGAFDPFAGDPELIKKGYAIAAREAGTLFDAAPGADVQLITPASVSEVARTPALPPALPSPENPVGDRLVGGQYVIHAEAQVSTPWLPDPAAAGIAIRAMPGHAIPGVSGEMELGPGCVVRRAPNEELVLLVRHGKEWPDSQGFRLRLAERKAAIASPPCAETFADDGRPEWDAGKRTLTLFLPKGRIARLRYASCVDRDRIDSFGIPHWAEDASGRNFAARMAVFGANWLITPFRPLVLVHATQHPVCEPALIKLQARRDPGDQHAMIDAQVDLHGPSTGKFEIEAEWHEWVDDLAQPEPTRVHRRGQLGEIRLAENHRNSFGLQSAVDANIVDPERPPARADRHELGDTRFRLVKYRARATTRFREYLPPSIYEDSKLVTRLGREAEGPAILLPAQDDAGAPVLRGTPGSELQTLVPASAPPDDPRLLYVVPSFRFSRSGRDGAATVTRIGNGLRVWLDRPWFSSGDGELLGVVIFGQNARFTDIPAVMQPLVTQWGRDPLWQTELPKSQTRVEDFPARVAHEAVKLKERPDDPSVTVVGHRVHWDGERRLWFADIELDPGRSYMPFVRLALVRYQPNALIGQKISNVVQAEFAQVLPRRHASCSRNGRSVQLTLHGRAPQAGPMRFDRDNRYLPHEGVQHMTFELGRNRVELVLQTRPPNSASDLDWRDEEVLASGPAGDSSDRTSLEFDPELVVRRVATGLVRTVEPRAGGSVSLAGQVERPFELRPAPGMVLQLDPEMFEAQVTLPETPRPSRLMLREFERFYSDRTIPERKGTRTLRRRVVEERLVFAAIFDL